jgi:uncharacterized protein with PIN domain
MAEIPLIDTRECAVCGTVLLRLTPPAVKAQMDAKDIVFPNAKCATCGQIYRFVAPVD